MRREEPYCWTVPRLGVYLERVKDVFAVLSRAVRACLKRQLPKLLCKV